MRLVLPKMLQCYCSPTLLLVTSLGQRCVTATSFIYVSSLSLFSSTSVATAAFQKKSQCVPRVRGTLDYFSPHQDRRRKIVERAQQLCSQYGYEEVCCSAFWCLVRTSTDFTLNKISTPICEHTELFAKVLGGDSDVVSKEMYTFTDRSNHSLTLRPENTAGFSGTVRLQCFLRHRQVLCVPLWSPNFPVLFPSVIFMLDPCFAMSVHKKVAPERCLQCILLPFTHFF